jgi:phosphoribosylaminoimidazolecarboxamide formyltransferase/IMP cyclohydrolase
MPRIQRALISVTDKSGIVPFARALVECGVEIVSTGGTAKLLANEGIPALDIFALTGFPEILDGRVKTLHPKVAAGILAIRSNRAHMATLDEHGILPIDMVVVNLYAFEKTASQEGVSIHDLIENIDIGGPTMIRAAAKNYQDVAVVTSPEDYASLTAELKAGNGSLSQPTHWMLAKKAYAMTAAYDRAITARLARISCDEQGFQDEPATTLPPVLDVHLPRALSLRYGENPHQSAALYSSGNGLAGARQLQGKELSYNNLVDLDAAWQLILEFDNPAAAIIKHTNPCGCAEQATLKEAYRMALEADPVSAFGGVLAFNRTVDEETAGEVAKIFTEAIAAPGYTQAALEVFATKKNLRLLEVAQSSADPLVLSTNSAHNAASARAELQDSINARSAGRCALKSISGGVLLQTADTHRLDRAEAKVRTKRAPTDAEWQALEFGWKVVKHVKSNAIVYARAGQIVSTGAGQMSRVDSVKVGAMKAVLPLAGSVLASDAFFPFPDGVEEAAQHGITAVIQPGGSVRDEEVVAACDRLDLAMVFTGVRHFRH